MGRSTHAEQDRWVDTRSVDSAGGQQFDVGAPHRPGRYRFVARARWIKRGSNGFVIASGLCVLVVAGCSGASNSAAASVHQHAVTAGNVMTRPRGPVAARAVALAVAGQGTDDTIDALAADGTTWGGSATIRISVENQNGAFGSTEDSTACFRYRFTYPRASDWGQPHQLNCDEVHVVDLTRPALPSGITSATRTTLLHVVARLLAAQRADAAVLTQSIRTTLGPDYTIAGAAQGAGGFVWVRYGDGCISVDASDPNRPQVGQPIQGLACFGG